jgi:hypothetical protein
MFIDKNNFPYEIKKEYLSKARVFKVLTLIYLLFYLGAIVGFIMLSYPLDNETKGFLTWMSIFGFVPLPILWIACKVELIQDIPLSIGQVHQWACGPDCNELVYPKTTIQKKNFFQKFLRDTSQEPYWKEKGPAWKFLDIIVKINLYGKISKVEQEPCYLGTYFNRLFRLDYAYFFNIFSFYKKAGGYILRTTPLKNIKSTILIRPTSPGVKKIKELQKVEIDTQNLFEIYTDNPQTLEQDLPQDFFTALIDYGKNIDKSITILISPEGIFCTKMESSMSDFFAPILFTSLKNAFIREWAKYENFINLIEIINLLEPKK